MPFDDATNLTCLGTQLLKARERLVFAQCLVEELRDYVRNTRYPDIENIARVLEIAREELEVIP